MITTEGTFIGVYCDTVEERFAVIANNKYLDYARFGNSGDTFSLSWSDLSLINNPEYNFPKDRKELWDYIAQRPELVAAFETVMNAFVQLHKVEKIAAGGRLYRFYID